MKNEYLFSMALDEIRGRKRSSFLIFFVLFLSFTCAMISLSLTESMDKTNEECRYDTYGIWEGAVLNVNERELNFLGQIPFIQERGMAQCYGKIAGNSGIGTVDEHLWKMGRLGLNSGRLPKSGDEVAVEADVLSALGYDYDLGQKIDLTVSVPAQYLDEQKQEEDAFPSIQVTKTYTLCGVLKEYKNLWEAGRKATLNSAILTEKGAQELLLEAKTKQEEMVPLPPEKNCFFTMKNHDTSKICEINEGLKQEDAEIQQEVLINTYAYPDVQQMEKKQLFHWAIFIVSLVAIVCLYMLQVRRQVYQIALFRSIGITKKQLRILIFFETALLGFPAAVLGSITGALGTWCLVKVLLRQKNAVFVLDIPVVSLVLFFTLWIIALAGMRILVLQMALKQPLTGRFEIQQVKKQKVNRMKGMLLAGLSVSMAGIVIFVCMEAFPIFYKREINEKSRSYSINALENPFACIPKEELSNIKAIPGVSKIDAQLVENCELRFEDMEENDFFQAVRENSEDTQPVLLNMIDGAGNKKIIDYPNGLGVSIYGIPEERMETLPHAEQVNKEAFREGKQVIIIFSTDVDGNLVYGGKSYTEAGIKAGDEIELNFYGFPVGERIERKASDVSIVGNMTAKVGAVIKVNREKSAYDPLLFTGKPYMVLCSYESLKETLENAKEGYELGFNKTGTELGYNSLDIYTSESAGYLSTDFIVADLCEQYEMNLRNEREMITASVQEAEREFFLLFFGGVCIILILLLTVCNILAFDYENQKRKIGVLKALGMSKRQLQNRLRRNSLKTAVFSVLCGWGVYGVWILGNVWKQQRYLQQEFQEMRSFSQVLQQQIESMKIFGIGGFEAFWISVAAFLAVFLMLYLSKRRLKNAKLF